MQRPYFLLSLFIPWGVAACDPVLLEAQTLPTTTTVIAEDAIIATFELPLATYTGVTVEPETGRRYTITELGEVRELGAAEVLWTAPPETQRWIMTDEPLGYGYTDLVALGQGQFALTTVGDGYLAQIPSDARVPHFRYEPDGFNEPDTGDEYDEYGGAAAQVTEALSHDPVTGRLWVQPATLDRHGGLHGDLKFIAEYDGYTGESLRWWHVKNGDGGALYATGMAVLEGGDDPRLLVANSTNLYVFDTRDGSWRSIGRLGDERIDGLAIDRETGTLLVLRGPPVVREHEDGEWFEMAIGPPVVSEVDLAALGL